MPGAKAAIDWRALRRVWRSYGPASFGIRAYVAGRLLVAPLGALAGELATISGNVLSLGSGYGVVERYLAEVNRAVEIDGVDLDARKVDLIRHTSGSSPRVRLEHGDATTFEPDRTYAAVIICDLLHHLMPSEHGLLVGRAASWLLPGGVLVVKDLAPTPAWKERWNGVHDRLVAGPEPIWCRSIDDMAELFSVAGLVVERAERIDRRFEPYAHYVVRGRRPR